MRLQIAKLNPIPCAFVVSKGEKILGNSSAGMPSPVSVKAICPFESS
jgi:hypothetical protein